MGYKPVADVDSCFQEFFCKYVEDAAPLNSQIILYISQSRCNKPFCILWLKRKHGAVEKAKIQKQTSELDLLDDQKTLYKTIETLWLDANSAQQRYAAATEKLKSTQTSYELIQEQFNLGMKNTVELLTEKSNLLSAQQETLQAKYMAILNMQLLKFYQGEKIEL